jgi:rRNA maturation protein Nop10
MSIATCPHCGTRFQNGRGVITGGLRSRLFMGPERLIAIAKRDRAAYDHCPQCGRDFVSAEFAVVGQFVRARLRPMASIYICALALIVAVVVAAKVAAS